MNVGDLSDLLKYFSRDTELEIRQHKPGANTYDDGEQLELMKPTLTRVYIGNTHIAAINVLEKKQ